MSPIPVPDASFVLGEPRRMRPLYGSGNAHGGRTLIGWVFADPDGLESADVEHLMAMLAFADEHMPDEDEP
jgi:hypothetical protein